jgi:serine/threonine protein kinase
MLAFVFICPDCRTIYQESLPRCERDGAALCEVQAHQSKARYPLLGRVVDDRYHLIGGLGQGGLGTVYLAHHLHLEHLFAVKFLDLETVGLDVSRDQRAEHLRDFMKEARVASLIRHDAVVRVSDFGEFDGLPYLVMEYVPGPSLLHMLAEHGRFAVPEAINIARRIAEALGAFHERRLVHRDLKPANVILDPRGNGQLTLVDLGLVKDISGHGGKASTHPMALRGTPGYLAPEQVPPWVISSVSSVQPTEKRLVDARVDIYALGVILYEMVAGVSPYPDGSNTQIIVYACTRDPLSMDSVEPPVKLIPGLAELIYDTMARDPNRRPQTPQDFNARLDEVAMGRAMQGSWPVMILPDTFDGRRLPPPPVASIPEPEAHTALYSVDGEASSPTPMEHAYAPARPSYPPSPADATMEAESHDSFDLLLDDSIASFDTGLHQTEGITEIQPDSANQAVPTQLTPMPAGLDPAISFDRPDEPPLPPQSAPPRSSAGLTNWIVLPGVALASAFVVWFVSSLVMAPAASTAPPALSPASSPPSEISVPTSTIKVTPVTGVPTSTIKVTPVTGVPTSTIKVSPAKVVPTSTITVTPVKVVPVSPAPDASRKPATPQPVAPFLAEPASRQPTLKPRPRRRTAKPKVSSLDGLLSTADSAYENLDCKRALPKYQEIISKLPKAHPKQAVIKTRIKFCKRHLQR